MSEIKIGADGLIEHKLPLAYGYFVEFADGTFEVFSDAVSAQGFVAAYFGADTHQIRKVAIYAVD